jgi:hypothetical protein
MIMLCDLELDEQEKIIRSHLNDASWRMITRMQQKHRSSYIKNKKVNYFFTILFTRIFNIKLHCCLKSILKHVTETTQMHLKEMSTSISPTALLQHRNTGVANDVLIIIPKP